jgi:hypothetical protein
LGLGLDLCDLVILDSLGQGDLLPALVSVLARIAQGTSPYKVAI